MSNPVIEDDLNRLYNKGIASENCCIIYTGHLDKDGYGRFYSRALKRQINAHKFMYEIEIGGVPKGFHVHHKCNNRACINKYHLETKSPANNANLALTHFNADKTHCPRNHEYTKENTYLNSKGHRVCKACVRSKYKNKKGLK